MEDFFATRGKVEAPHAQIQTIFQAADSPFAIQSLLGTGRMAFVFDATQAGTGQRVALKVLKPAVARETQWLERFILEADVLSNLEHPSIVKVYSSGVYQNYRYIAL